MDHLMHMEASEGLFLIQKAIEKQQEEKAYQLWTSVYPHMENPIAFEQFYKPMNQDQQVKQLSAQEVIEKAERIRKAHQGEGG